MGAAKKIDSTKLTVGCPALERPDRQYGFVWQVPNGQSVLALDLGEETGWAVRWDQEHQASGRFSFAHKPGETRGQTLFRFRSWLREFLSFAPLGLVIYQASREAWRRRRQQTVLQAQLEGVLLAELEAAQERARLVCYVMPTPRQLFQHGRESHWDGFLGRAKTDEERAALRLLSWFFELKGERPAA